MDGEISRVVVILPPFDSGDDERTLLSSHEGKQKGEEEGKIKWREGEWEIANQKKE
jgi:hypothetical protein